MECGYSHIEKGIAGNLVETDVLDPPDFYAIAT